jgi:dTDP-3-amino-3,4,6-trideoxy-alpha-D-glucose transaminase
MCNLRFLLDATAPAWRGYLREVFDAGQFVLGRQVARFEREFAGLLGAQHAIGVGSGTDALEISLRCAGVSEPGQEVLTSALTSPYTAVAIRAAGAAPRFADVDPQTLLLDPADAAQRITGATAALLPVHLYGQVCALDRLQDLARRSGAVLVQDACQAHGARFDGKALTNYSACVAYSFYPTKNLGCLGDGGAVLTNCAEAAGHARLLRNGGRREDQIAWFCGVNSRLDELQACYLRAFLPHLNEWNAHRRHIAAIYDALLSTCETVQPVRRSPESVCHLYVIRTPYRDALRERLSQLGIATGVHYPAPLHLHPAFRSCGLRQGDLPHAERACNEIVSLPLWPGMPDSMAEQVAGAVVAFHRAAGRKRKTQ